MSARICSVIGCVRNTEYDFCIKHKQTGRIIELEKENDELQSELLASEDHTIKYLEKENAKLKSMIEHGLGFEDMVNPT
jgi:hypothetical protein